MPDPILETIVRIIGVMRLIERHAPILIAVVVAIVGVAIAVGKSSSSRKLRTVSMLSACAVVALVVVVVAPSWRAHLDAPRVAADREKSSAEQFVRGHSDVIAAAGSPVLSQVLTIHGSLEKPLGYEAYVTGSKQSFYAIVEVNRGTTPPSFSLACITKLSSGETSNRPCEKPEPRESESHAF